MKLKTLLSRLHPLSQSHNQLNIINDSNKLLQNLPRFNQTLGDFNMFTLAATEIEVLQINLGKMCNQTCEHCHVDAGPDRKEIMTRETMQQCIDVVKQFNIPTVDLTGGAPELNPNFRWFVQELVALKCLVIDRCNLTIILANKNFLDLPLFFAKNKVQVISSLPSFQKDFTDKQRGNGVFDKSIRALKMLNEAGYAQAGSDLELNLVYNPMGATLPACQKQLELDFKHELKHNFNIEFNKLYCITNMPISRFLDYLLASGDLEKYMELLINSFNPSTLNGLMCRKGLSVGWDGKLYDCDFNQMLDIPISIKSIQHIKDFNTDKLQKRNIMVNQHCYGCTASGGSSCGGAIT